MLILKDNKFDTIDVLPKVKITYTNRHEELKVKEVTTNSLYKLFSNSYNDIDSIGIDDNFYTIDSISVHDYFEKISKDIVLYLDINEGDLEEIL